MSIYLNKNIKYLRKIKNVSQEAIASNTGIDRSILSRIENNKIETSIDNLETLSNYFNVSMSDLVSKDLSGNNVIYEKITRSEFISEVNNLLNKADMSEKDKNILKAILENIKED